MGVAIRPSLKAELAPRTAWSPMSGVEGERVLGGGHKAVESAQTIDSEQSRGRGHRALRDQPSTGHVKAVEAKRIGGGNGVCTCPGCGFLTGAVLRKLCLHLLLEDCKLGLLLAEQCLRRPSRDSQAGCGGQEAEPRRVLKGDGAAFRAGSEARDGHMLSHMEAQGSIESNVELARIELARSTGRDPRALRKRAGHAHDHVGLSGGRGSPGQCRRERVLVRGEERTVVHRTRDGLACRLCEKAILDGVDGRLAGELLNLSRVLRRGQAGQVLQEVKDVLD
eukprot:scaffold90599_cov31-Tisochrysis_lutea.AAC.1